MKISIITLFPEVFDPILNSSILKRAQNKGKVTFELINLRDFGLGKHKTVDDRVYGGGVGMLIKPDVLANAVHKLRSHLTSGNTVRVILTSASGKPYKQTDAKRFSKLDHLILICGHYEGVDQRFIDKYVSEEISIGDYVLTGGEIPAMVIVDTVVRLIPGVLEKPEAVTQESFSNYTLNAKPYVSEGKESSAYTLLEGPQYTRPEIFEGKKIPPVLLSGNHAKIAKWRSEQAFKKTKKVRPDLLK